LIDLPRDYSQNFIFLVFFARPLSHSDFFLFFFLSFFLSLPRTLTTARPGLLPGVVVHLRGVGRPLPDVGDLHGDVWNLLREPSII
jgi:hypothetical protein